MGLDETEQEHARAAGYLHDLGKLAVPSRLLRKPDALDDSEHERIRRHASDGAELLGEIPVLELFAPACRHHHERWDGRGDPDGLAGEGIPRVARILAVVDAYDAMTSARAYRPGRPTRRRFSRSASNPKRSFLPSKRRRSSLCRPVCSRRWPPSTMRAGTLSLRSADSNRAQGG